MVSDFFETENTSCRQPDDSFVTSFRLSHDAGNASWTLSTNGSLWVTQGVNITLATSTPPPSNHIHPATELSFKAPPSKGYRARSRDRQMQLAAPEFLCSGRLKLDFRSQQWLRTTESAVNLVSDVDGPEDPSRNV